MVQATHAALLVSIAALLVTSAGWCLTYFRNRQLHAILQPEHLVGDAPSAMLTVNVSGTITAANTLLAQLFGYDSGELVGQPLEMLLPARFRDAHSAQRHDFLQRPQTRVMGLGRRELLGRRRDGSEFPVEVGLNRVQTPEGPCVVASVTDISDRRRVERELAEANTLTRSIIHSAPFSIVATDTEGVILAVSPATERLLRYRSEELVGHCTPAVFHDACEMERRARELTQEFGEPVSDFEVFVAKARRGMTEAREWTYVRKDGSRLPVQLTVTALHDENDRLTGFLGIAYDISERKRADDYIRFLAHHDVLTGLPNRTLLQDRLDTAITRARRYQGKVGLMLVDLDHFKRINDTLGHHTGDQLLVQVAQRLARCVRSSDTVARLGGDEFVLVLPDISSVDDLQRLAEELVRSVGQPLELGGQLLRITPSVGGCLFPDHGDNADDLLRRADAAMYGIKEGGRCGFGMFSAEPLVTRK